MLLDKIDLNQTVSTKEFGDTISELRPKLSGLVQKAKALDIPIIVVFEGWGSSGKGTLISKILYPLDPRDFNVYTMDKVNEDIVMRPYLWAYWVKTPLKGRLAIFDKSWHRILHEHKLPLTTKDKAGFYKDVNDFERQLADDGNVIIKMFLHISKQEQKRRFDALLGTPSTNWRVDDEDMMQNKEYEQNLSTFEEVLQNTNQGFAPWYIIESEDRNYAAIKAYKILISVLEKAIANKQSGQEEQSVKADTTAASGVKIIDGIDMDKSILNKEYKLKLKSLQDEMRDLGFQLYTKRRSVVIVYEGWDAAGKGGNIKRLTEGLDPRGYEVIPIAAPTADEKSHHYLWRFWNKMPKDGHIAIFDRSWYGRVMVERVEGFCTENEYRRAYFEMNEMERHMANHGTVILKFWLNIDKEEQLNRFKERENNPLKRYKITDEDWRNRQKWDLYKEAIDEMLFRTSTDYAPWHIIESNVKKYARIRVLEIVVNRLKEALVEQI